MIPKSRYGRVRYRLTAGKTLKGWSRKKNLELIEKTAAQER
jgi:hypothetical protein